GQPIRLDDSKKATTVALLPEGPAGVPLLAVAFNWAGDVHLFLYNVQTGEELRWLAGPVNEVRCLAFSADGLMLAAASDDQTVCLWSLANLGETLGNLGELRGVVVREAKDDDSKVADKDNYLTVIRIEDTLAAANRDKIKRDDVVVGRVENGQVKLATRT